MTNTVSPAQVREQWARIAKMPGRRQKTRTPRQRALPQTSTSTRNVQRPSRRASVPDTIHVQVLARVPWKGWTVRGKPAQCIAEIREYADAGWATSRSGSRRGTSAASSSVLAEVAPALARR